MKGNQFLKNEAGDVNLIMTAIVLAITLVMGVIITFAVIGGVNLTTIDANYRASIGASNTGIKPAANATNTLVSNVNTFYQIAPIMLVVIAAVGILSYLFILRTKAT